MSRTCKACCLKPQLKNTDPINYAHWKNSHICNYNYQGTAGGMETEGAKRVFERSVEKHNLRYVKFLGDGDSKSYQTVKNTYPGIEVEKLVFWPLSKKDWHSFAKVEKEGKGSWWTWKTY